MLTHQILSAICRTFVHSIWQGIVAAALAGAILALTRRSSALRRYNLLGVVLLLCMVTTSVTLYLELQSVSAAAPVQQPVDVVLAPAPFVTLSYWDLLMNYLNTHAPFIMLVWSIIFLFKCFRMGVGFYHIHYIRHHKAYEPDQKWNDRLQQLADLLGLRKTVRLVESALVQVPLTTGFIKPCIFVPLGLLTQLPADQVEAILLHELAHIRRRDYLVNIVQSIAESIFFFNPALLWISARLREEREACCDDVAVTHTPHKASYLHALVAFAGRASAGKLEMAINRKQTLLLSRVKRMLTRENEKLTIMEKSVLIMGLVVISAFTLMPAPVQPEQPEHKSAEAFIVYKPSILSPSAGKNKELIIQAVKRDTVTPGNTRLNTASNINIQYSFAFDSSLNVNLNKDTLWSNIAFNYAATKILNQYDLNIQNNVSTNVNNDIVYVKIDSSRMQYLKQLSIDSGNMQYLKKIPLNTRQQYNYSFEFDFKNDSTHGIAEQYYEILKKQRRDNDTLQPLKKNKIQIKGAKDEWKELPDSSGDKGRWKSPKPGAAFKKDISFSPKPVIIRQKKIDKPVIVFADSSRTITKKKLDKPVVVFTPKSAVAGKFDKPVVIFKPKTPKSALATKMDKPRVIFKKAAPDSSRIKEVKPPSKGKQEGKTVPQGSVKPGDGLPETPAADASRPKKLKKETPPKKPDVLEEKLPADFYNSLILPKKIDC